MATLHLVNWNVNGIRSIMKKDFVRDIEAMNPDMLCLQETKASSEEVKSLCELFPAYKTYVNSSKARKGYSGTAILTKIEPISVTFDMAIEEHDQEGRVITAEFEKFFLVTVYTPNSGEGLKRLDYRENWDTEFRNYILSLKARKPVIVTGDLNVAHKAIDIARAKENYNKSSGYTQREIDGFDQLLSAGFVDSFRHSYPEEIKYTYWNQMFNARARNTGWRIDYFLVDDSLVSNITEAQIYNEYFGSDHCPIALNLEV
ncbi:MAG: xth [Sphingobacteriales bacterium]|nr:xth [Sphingobacteriales bacterium]